MEYQMSVNANLKSRYLDLARTLRILKVGRPFFFWPGRQMSLFFQSWDWRFLEGPWIVDYSSLCNFWGEDWGDFNLRNVFHSVLIRLYCLMFCTTINIGKMSLNFLQAAGFYYTSIDTRHYIKLKQKIHSLCCVFQSFQLSRLRIKKGTYNIWQTC